MSKLVETPNKFHIQTRDKSYTGLAKGKSKFIYSQKHKRVFYNQN